MNTLRFSHQITPVRRFALMCGLGLSLVLGGCSDGPDDLGDLALSLRMEPNPLRFDALGVGAEQTKTLVLINNGNGTITLDGPLVIEGGEGAFEVSGADAAFPLAPGGDTTLTVRFAPPLEGPIEARLRVTPVGGDSFSSTLSGEGEPSSITLAPERLVFGDVWAGEQAAQDITVTNTGDIPTTFTLAVQSAGYTIDGTSVRSVNLGAGASETLPVVFAPVQSGPVNGTLVAQTCGEGCGPSVALEGRGLAPRIDVTPRPIDFGEVAVGESATTDVEVTNTGAGTLGITRVSLDDPAGSLSWDVAANETFALEAGASRTLTLTLSPGAPTSSYGANLTLESTDALSPRVIVPVRATVPGRALTLAPTAVHFGHLFAGETDAADFVLRAEGTEPVTLTDVRFEGAAPDTFFLSAFPALPLTLDAGTTLIGTMGAACTLADQDAGGAAAVLIVEGDFGTASLNTTFGSGLDGCVPRAEPQNANIGYVRVGEGGNQRTLIHNEGTATCNVSRVGIATGLPFDPGFSYAAYAEAIVPGDALEVRFAYQAASSGAASAFVEVELAEYAAPLLVSATAHGVSGALAPLPASHAFGPMVQGCGDDAKTFLFVNEGAQDVTLTGLSLHGASPHAFELINVPSFPATVQPGLSLSVTVSAKSDDLGLFSADLRADNSILGPVTAALSSEVVEDGTLTSETFEIGEAPEAVDILFVVDNSGSMEDDQTTLASNFSDFIAAAGSGAVIPDFHIGVVTTDVLSSSASAGRLVGMPRYLDASTSNLAQTFASHAQVGTTGVGLELGLEAMRQALSEPNASGANNGFLRPGAALSVIVVSDEDDGGPFAEASGFPAYGKSVDSYVSFLSAIKAGTLTSTPVLFSGVIPPFADRYGQVIDAFGGVRLNIGTADWGNDLSALGAATFDLAGNLLLGAVPIDGTVTVTVDGLVITTFTVDGRTVTLDESPAPGSVVEVTYGAVCGGS